MYQQVILVGRFGGDLELRRTQNGYAVLSANLATNSVRKNDAGEKIETTEWHKIVIWQNAAEATAKYCTVGSLVQVIGELRTRKWQDCEGKDRYTTEIHAKKVLFLKHPEAESERLPDQSQAGPVIDDEDIPF